MGTGTRPRLENRETRGTPSDGRKGYTLGQKRATRQVQRVEGNMGSVQGRVTILTNEGAVKH